MERTPCKSYIRKQQGKEPKSIHILKLCPEAGSKYKFSERNWYDLKKLWHPDNNTLKRTQEAWKSSSVVWLLLEVLGGQQVGMRWSWGWMQVEEQSAGRNPKHGGNNLYPRKTKPAEGLPGALTTPQEFVSQSHHANQTPKLLTGCSRCRGSVSTHSLARQKHTRPAAHECNYFYERNSCICCNEIRGLKVFSMYPPTPSRGNNTRPTALNIYY